MAKKIHWEDKMVVSLINGAGKTIIIGRKIKPDPYLTPLTKRTHHGLKT